MDVDVLGNGLPQSHAYDIVYRHAFAVNLNAITLHLGPLQVAFGSRRTVSLSTPKNRLGGLRWGDLGLQQSFG